MLHGHKRPLTSVAFSADGTRLVTASQDHDMIEWRTADGERLRTLRPHIATVSDAAFSPSGHWIVTAGPSTAGLLDADTGKRLILLRGHHGRLTGVTFDETGQRIFTVGVDGTVRIYHCEICGGLRELEAVARGRLRRF